MTKRQFMDTLDRALQSLPYEERREILADYEEHFAQGAAEGLSESEICAHLGDPENIAREYVASSHFQRAEQAPTFRNTVAAIFSAVGLGALNIFIVIPVFLVLLGVFLAGFGLSFSGIVVSVVFLFLAGSTAYLLLWMGLLCFSLLSFIAVFKLFQILMRGTVSYIKANANIISGKN